MKLKQSLKEDRKGNILYIFDEETGYIYELNETGMKVWDMLLREVSEEDMIQELKKEYDVSEEEIRKDIKSFFSKLTEYGLLEEDQL